VTPVVSESNTLRVNFPHGNELWVDWWDPSKIYAGGLRINYETALNKFPAFLRKGSIIPLRVTSTEAGHGDTFSQGAYTILITRPIEGKEIQNIYEDHGTGLIVSYERVKDKMTVVVTSHPNHKVIILLRGLQSFTEIVDELQEKPLEHVFGPLHKLATIGVGYHVDRETDDIFIRAGGLTNGVMISIHGIVDAYATVKLFN